MLWSGAIIKDFLCLLLHATPPPLSAMYPEHIQSSFPLSGGIAQSSLITLYLSREKILLPAFEKIKEQNNAE